MPSRRQMALFALAIVALLAGLLWWAAAWEPAFYLASAPLNGDDRTVKQLSKSLVQTAMQLGDEIRNEPAFAAEFSEAQVNAWLADELERKYRQILPPWISRPRVHFGESDCELAFRGDLGPVTAVFSGAVKLWVTDDHRLALEIEALRAGRIPLPVADLLDPVVQNIQRDSRRVEWRQAHGRDVVVVDLLSAGIDGVGHDSIPVLESAGVSGGVLRLRGRRRPPAR